jgi:hypothetical protein
VLVLGRVRLPLLALDFERERIRFALPWDFFFFEPVRKRFSLLDAGRSPFVFCARRGEHRLKKKKKSNPPRITEKAGRIWDFLYLKKCFRNKPR